MIIAGCGLGVFGLGLLDDVRGVRPFHKLAFETALGSILWFAGIRAGLFGFAPVDFLLTIAWVVGITNAVNLIDNIDGLASSVAAIASLAYFAIAAPQGDYLVAAFAAVSPAPASGSCVTTSRRLGSSSATPDRSCSASCSRRSVCCSISTSPADCGW